jgi:hypothetical protein|tara:strand:+ start:2567 stop:2983 length:417 start_codon:yes stop_codon:yes gene_type:complete
MKKETVKTLNDILDIADDIIDIEEPEKTEQAPAVEITTTDLTSDYDFSREQYHNIIEKGNEALIELLSIAKEGEQPRAFEVATQLMNSLAATTKELLILQKTKKEVEGNKTPSGKTENNLFIGSTSELQKLLDMKKKK